LDLKVFELEVDWKVGIYDFAPRVPRNGFEFVYIRIFLVGFHFKLMGNEVLMMKNRLVSLGVDTLLLMLGFDSSGAFGWDLWLDGA
jgi:hypothetical protein